MRPFDQELDLCQRQLFVVDPGVSSANANLGVVISNMLTYFTINFPRKMRATPTGSDSAASDWQSATVAGVGTGSSSAFGNLSPKAGTYQLTHSSSGASGGNGAFLRTVNTSSLIKFDARL